MEIVELDLLDGRGLVLVAVADEIEAVRLRGFMRIAAKAFDLVDLIKELEREI